ncbi:hypothetical protein FB451DRAFT_1528012 [Mycena latifolia]|nr:hypothetical protein FB451DRAFT_1528012 [Mycena latifolia]
MHLPFVYIVLAYATSASAGVASSFMGSTTNVLFPPANATITAADTFFPDASHVGYGGPTLNAPGDEAGTIATTPAVALVDSVFPLIKPATSDKKPGFDVLQHLGSLSPFQSVESLGLPHASAHVPDGCKITQVHLLHRHDRCTIALPTSSGGLWAPTNASASAPNGGTRA